jgi:DNA-binding NtrC family response regulator
MNNGAAIKVLIIEDEKNIRRGLAMGLASSDIRVEEAENGRDGLKSFQSGAHEIVITDLKLPGDLDGLDVVRSIKAQAPETLIIVITAHGSVETAVEAMRCGAFDFIPKPVDLNLIRQQVKKAAERRRLVSENRRLKKQLAASGWNSDIIGVSEATTRMLKQIHQVADTDVTVLIHGESGSGKELAARAIHGLSRRSEGPFIPVNLGALPDTLMESELFGHEKGAFTDAKTQKTGRFEEANGGSLFLDEITETTPKSQLDLLRTLEERSFRRLGGSRLIEVDTRILSATNKNIETLIQEGKFREDLFYRLNVVPLRVPPLRERTEDIPLLIEKFLETFCSLHHRSMKRFSRSAINQLLIDPWRGNIRELKNLVERLVVTVEADEITQEDLPEKPNVSSSMGGENDDSSTLSSAVEAAEKQAIVNALKTCRFNRTNAAGLLDVSVRTLHYKMSRYNIRD